ncbi:MAG: FAD-dependent oxidoreductase [Chloroflexota bacterium]
MRGSWTWSWRIPSTASCGRSLDLRSRRDVLLWAGRCADAGAHLLSELTDGEHVHTLEADHEAILDVAQDALRRQGSWWSRPMARQPTGARAAETFDLVVVGAGVAGLSAALAAADRGARVVVLSKGPLDVSASYLARGRRRGGPGPGRRRGVARP